MPVNRPQTRPTRRMRSRKKPAFAEDTRTLGRISGDSRLSDLDIAALRQLIDAEKKKEKAARNLGRIKGSRLSDRDIAKKKATKTQRHSLGPTTRTKIKRK